MPGAVAVASPPSRTYIRSGADDRAFLPGKIIEDGLIDLKEMGMSWLYLFVAGLFEIGWAVGLKYTHGFTRLWPSLATAASMAVSLGLLGLALRNLPLGTAYAVWTGIGTVGTAAFGIVVLGEPATALRMASIALIVAGIAGLKLL